MIAMKKVFSTRSLTMGGIAAALSAGPTEWHEILGEQVKG